MLSEIMNRDLVTIEPHETVSKAAQLMADNDVGCVLVLDNGSPRGLLTDRDIVVRCVAENVDVDDCTIENIMTESLETVEETAGVFDCIQKMKKAHVRRIPVVNDEDQVVGIISFSDLFQMLSKEMGALAEGTSPFLDEYPSVA